MKSFCLSKCFVLALNDISLALTVVIAAWLSQFIVMGLYEIPKTSWLNLLSQIAFLHPSKSACISASYVEAGTRLPHLLDQLMVAFLN